MNDDFLRTLEEQFGHTISDERYLRVLKEIDQLVRKRNFAVIAIDGRCGSGKTSLANLIGTIFPCNILHMDEFYLPLEQREKNWIEIPAGNMDLKRFLREVLCPLRQGTAVSYRPYCCKKGCMGDAVVLKPCELTIVEGSYSLHPLLAAQYDLTVFLTCRKQEQRRRLQMREGSNFSVFETRWIPLEEHYLWHYAIESAARITVDTSGFDDNIKEMYQNKTEKRKL